MKTDLTFPEIEAVASVLVVEDNEDIAYMLGFMLEREGISVRTAANGRDAEEIISKCSPTDAVIMDIMLPYVDGFELITQIRENPLWRDVPIIVLSGKVAEGDIVRALELGANDYVTKPYRPQELIARIRRHTKSKGRR